MTVTRTTQRVERLRTLTEVSRALTYATSIEEVLGLAVERAAELMGAGKALIMLADEDGLLVVRAAHGLDPDRVRELREPLTETLIQRLQGLLGYPTPECFLSVPLVAHGEVTGLLAVVRADAGAAGAVGAAGDGTGSYGPGGEDDEWLLSALADQAAVALENARLTQAVRAQQGEAARVAEAEDRSRATLSHELRSPLMAIQSYSELLLDGHHGPLNDRQRESIARIRTAGDHLLSIIENILDAARLAAGHLPMTPEDLPIDRVLAEALDMVRPRFARKRQELRAGETGGLVVRGDPNHLRQALVNLLANASKYTPDGGVTEVTVERREERGNVVAAIAIADNGRGIPHDALPHLFEPYNRAGAPSNEPGMGLGLYICRQLVRQMEGDIHVATRPGEGSTFTVLLPLAES